MLKVVKGSFRDAYDLYGFLKYNPAITFRLPKKCLMRSVGSNSYYCL